MGSKGSVSSRKSGASKKESRSASESESESELEAAEEEGEDLVGSMGGEKRRGGDQVKAKGNGECVKEERGEAEKENQCDTARFVIC